MFFALCFLFLFAFSHFENRERTEGKGQMVLGVKNRKTKSRSTGIVKSWYFCLCLLCSIFDWTVSGKSVGRRQEVFKCHWKHSSCPTENSPFLSSLFSGFSSFLDFQIWVFLPCSLLLFPALRLLTVWYRPNQKGENRDRLSFGCNGLGFEFSL